MKRSRIIGKRSSRVVAFFSTSLLFLIIAGWVRGESSPSAPHNGESFGVRVGISGAYKSGFQTPIVVEFGNLAPRAHRVALETLDADGAPFVQTFDVASSDRESGSVETRFLLPRAKGTLTIRILDEQGATIAEKTLAPGRNAETDNVVFSEPSNPSKPIYLVVGDANLGFEEAFVDMRVKRERQPIVVAVSSLSELPKSFQAYEAVDRIFFTTSNPDAYSGATRESESVVAINEWIRRGGTAIVLAGRRSLPVVTGDGALAGFIPGKKFAPTTHEFRALNSLMNELQNVKNLVMTGSSSSPFLMTPVLSELDEYARVEIQETETPLLVSNARGLGSIVYCAFDLSEAPISNWSGRGRLLLKVLGLNPDDANSRTTVHSFSNHSYVDLSGQLRSALDQFEGVAAPSFAVVGGLILIYLLVVAPLDWFVVKKKLKKPMATWATFPITIVAFSALAVWLTTSRAPKEPILNQVDLIDYDLESGMVRDTTWFGFYSPHGRRYDFHYEATAPERPGASSTLVDATSFVAPLGLSGESLGGSEQNTYAPRLWNESYQLASGDLKKVPIATRSSKSFVGRWTGRFEENREVPSLYDDGLTLQGEIYNPFSAPMYSTYVVFEGAAYALGTLPPGSTKIERGLARLDPKRALNERGSSMPTDSLAASAYNAMEYNGSSTRAPYILRTASFYDFGGGVENFGIENILQRDVDLSAALRCGRAVIYGVIVDPDAEKYRPSEEMTRQALDATEWERYNQRQALQRGEEYKDSRREALDKYGLYGSAEEFRASTSQITAVGDDKTIESSRRFVVARLTVPIKIRSSHLETAVETK